MAMVQSGDLSRGATTGARGGEARKEAENDKLRPRTGVDAATAAGVPLAGVGFPGVNLAGVCAGGAWETLCEGLETVEGERQGCSLRMSSAGSRGARGASSDVVGARRGRRRCGERRSCGAAVRWKTDVEKSSGGISPMAQGPLRTSTRSRPSVPPARSPPSDSATNGCASGCADVGDDNGCTTLGSDARTSRRDARAAPLGWAAREVDEGAALGGTKKGDERGENAGERPGEREESSAGKSGSGARRPEDPSAA
jgi:hypothetical protein